MIFLLVKTFIVIILTGFSSVFKLLSQLLNTIYSRNFELSADVYRIPKEKKILSIHLVNNNITRAKQM